MKLTDENATLQGAGVRGAALLSFGVDSNLGNKLRQVGVSHPNKLQDFSDIGDDDILGRVLQGLWDRVKERKRVGDIVAALQ